MAELTALFPVRRQLRASRAQALNSALGEALAPDGVGRFLASGRTSDVSASLPGPPRPNAWQGIVCAALLKAGHRLCSTP